MFYCKYSLIKLALLCTVITATFANTVEIQPYGFLKTSVMYGTAPINSFSNINMVAPTSAGNKELYQQGNDRTNFQVAQSRIGSTFSFNTTLKGLLEMDFVDFSQSSPTTQARPRLRRAYLEKVFSNNWSLRFGQDWDTFSPLGPSTFDIIGYYFNGGNTGFMRNQIKLSKIIDTLSLEFALGQTNKNADIGNNNIEEENQLSLAFNIQKNLSNFSTLTFSTITARANYINTTSKTPYAFSLGYEVKYKSSHLKTEAYIGRGMASLNLLDLPGGNYAESFGGFITYEYSLKEFLILRLGQGFSKRSAVTSSTINLNKSYSNLGLKENIVSRVAFAKNFGPLQIYTEATHFISNFITTSNANTVEIGFLTKF